MVAAKKKAKQRKIDQFKKEKDQILSHLDLTTDLSGKFGK